MNNNFSKLLALSILVLVASCSTPKDNIQRLSEARASIQNGNNAEAAINLKNIIQDDPKHDEARFLLGKVYLAADNYAGAEKEFTKALKINPEKEQAALLLAKTQLLLSKFPNIIDTLSNLQFSNVDDQIYSLLLLGQANLSLNNIEQAKENIQDANDLSSSSQHSILGRAFVAVYENSNEKALELVNKLLVQDNTFQEAWLLKGSILSNQEKFKAAADAYSEYYKLRPKNIGIRTIIAHNYVRAGEYELAKEHIFALQKINENHPTINTLAAQIKYSEGDYETAKVLATSVTNSTNNGLARMISGLSDFQLQNYEQAYSSLNAISDNLPKDHKVHKILAILQVKLGYTDELTESLLSFSDNAEDSGIYASIGMEYVRQGDKESALEMFEKANKLSPSDAKVKAQLGVLKLNNTDTSGVDELSEAVKLDPNFRAANIALAMTHLKNGEIEKAVEIADAWIALNPKNSTAIVLRGNIALKANEQDKAIQYFIKASEVDSKDIMPLFNLAVINANRLAFDKSNHYLDKLFAIDLEYPFAYRLAISNSLQMKQQKKLKNKLLAFIEQSPSAVWPKVILARKLAIEGQHDKAIDILEKDADYAKLPNVYFQSLSSVLLENQNTTKLSAMYEKWQRAQPNNEISYLHEATYLDKTKDYTGALEVIRSALSTKMLKSNFKLLSLEAYYLLATKQTELASQKVNLLAKNTPQNPLLLRIQGQVAMTRALYTEAIDLLFRSYQGNKKEVVGLMLVSAYKANRNKAEAIEFLEQEQHTFDKSGAYKKLLTEFYISDEPHRAIESYKEILVKFPNDIVVLNNIAWLYYEQGEFNNALLYSEQAIKLAPRHPQVLDTYALILVKINRFPQAIETLKLALSLAEDDVDIKAHLAQAYLANSQPEQAKKLSN